MSFSFIQRYELKNEEIFILAIVFLNFFIASIIMFWYRNWISRDNMFIGMVVAVPGIVDTFLRSGKWKLCNGEVLNIIEYPDLFQVIGHFHGGGAERFALPNLQGMFLRGLDPQGFV